MIPFREAIAVVEAEGARLREEFFRADGPRGQKGSAPIDTEIEERLREKLQALLPCTFAGEETGTTPGLPQPGGPKWTWLVDPQDGTSEFLSGRRGSSIAVALLRGSDAVLGIVHSPLAPDRGPDTIAWAEGELLERNGVPVPSHLGDRALAPGELVWTNYGSSLRPLTYAAAVMPARFVAMPSIAYRLARVAAGDGVAAISVHPVNEYDIAAGLALVRAAGGVMLDAQGRDVVLTGDPEARVSGCFAGSRAAAEKLARVSWLALDQEPRRAVRVALGFPRRDDPARLERAQGCLLGHLIGNAAGAPPDFHTMPGQPADAGELALVLARTLIQSPEFDVEKTLEAYRAWLASRPVDVDETVERALLGTLLPESVSCGALARVAPVGIWAAGDPARAAQVAREDSRLTHSNPACREAAAAYCAAIAAGVAGGSVEDMLEAARRHAAFTADDSPVAHALQAAFDTLAAGQPFAESIAATIARGSQVETQAATQAAITGALLGAAQGRAAIPARWILPVLACRPLAEAGAPRPRPWQFWPDDVLELAEALLR